MGQVTHEQANLMLKLYELRREPRLRQARAWFIGQFSAATPEEMLQKYPPGSEENASIRMTVSYWEMAAGLANRGLMDDELFFENHGEVWVVWERMRHLAPAMRQLYKNPNAHIQMERVCQRLEAWREKVAPGSTELMRQFLAQRMQPGAKAASS